MCFEIVTKTLINLSLLLLYKHVLVRSKSPLTTCDVVLTKISITEYLMTYLSDNTFIPSRLD